MRFQIQSLPGHHDCMTSFPIYLSIEALSPPEIAACSRNCNGKKTHTCKMLPTVGCVLPCCGTRISHRLYVLCFILQHCLQNFLRINQEKKQYERVVAYLRCLKKGSSCPFFWNFHWALILDQMKPQVSHLDKANSSSTFSPILSNYLSTSSAVRCRIYLTCSSLELLLGGDSRAKPEIIN